MERPQPAPFRGSGPFLEIAPPLSLPLRHFALAAVSFVLFAFSFAIGAPRLLGWNFEARFALGLVHLLTLGWVAQTILGAWSQMIPVHGGVPLVSVAWAKRAWWMFLAGFAAFVAALWSGSDRYWIGAALVYSSVVVSLIVLAATHLRAARWDWTWTYFSAAFFWFAAAGTAGVLMAIDRHRGVLFHDPDGGLIAHVHMALVGFAGSTILGAGYRLFPGIALSQVKSKLESRLAFVCFQCGLTGLALDALFLGRRWTALWACLMALAYVAYFLQIRPVFSGHFKLNASLSFLALALAGGLLWAALGLLLAFGRLPDDTGPRAAYVYCALVGFITPVILSQIHKIAPFLVWVRVYSPQQWRPPISVPKIDDISSTSLPWLELAALAMALPLGVAGFLRESPPLLRSAGICLAVCALAYALNTALLLRHVLRPDSRWSYSQND